MTSIVEPTPEQLKIQHLNDELNALRGRNIELMGEVYKANSTIRELDLQIEELREDIGYRAQLVKSIKGAQFERLSYQQRRIGNLEHDLEELRVQNRVLKSSSDK